MDLVALMKQEIALLHLKDKKDIQNHLYQRVGEIFEYEPYWKFASVLEQYKIAKQKIDVHNVTNFYGVCFDLAPMFINLCKEFAIEAREEGNAGHAYVVTSIDGKDYQFDLTKGFEDFMRIKFGLKMHYYYDSPSQNDNRKYKNTEKGLEQIKQKLQALMPRLDKDEYVYQVFLTINKILAFYEPENVGIVTGVEFVNYLLKYFISEKYLPCNTRFFNQKEYSFTEVYSFIVKGKMHYFLYQKVGEKYQLLETTEEKVKNIMENSKPDKKENLILLKGQPNYLKFKKMEETLKKAKKELKSLMSNFNEEEYIYQNLIAIQNIVASLNISDSNIEMIQYFIHYFIGDRYPLDCTHFRNPQSNDLCYLYSFKVNDNFHYFLYQKRIEKYELVEISGKDIQSIKGSFEIDKSPNYCLYQKVGENIELVDIDEEDTTKKLAR